MDNFFRIQKERNDLINKKETSIAKVVNELPEDQANDFFYKYKKSNSCTDLT